MIKPPNRQQWSFNLISFISWCLYFRMFSYEISFDELKSHYLDDFIFSIIYQQPPEKMLLKSNNKLDKTTCAWITWWQPFGLWIRWCCTIKSMACYIMRVDNLSFSRITRASTFDYLVLLWLHGFYTRYSLLHPNLRLNIWK